MLCLSLPKVAAPAEKSRGEEGRRLWASEEGRMTDSAGPLGREGRRAGRSLTGLRSKFGGSKVTARG